MVQTLGELLPEAARRYGDKTALIIDGRSFSFNALEAQSNAFANGLVAAGIAPGDTVTLYGPNSWQWMVAYYAIAKTGAVVNPVNTLLTPEEVKYIVERLAARGPSSPPRTRPAPLMDMKADTGLSQVVIWGDKVPAGATPFDTLAEGRQGVVRAAAARPQGHRRHLLHLGHHRAPQGRGAERALHHRHGARARR